MNDSTAPSPAMLRDELAAIVADLQVVSDRIDRAGDGATIGHGLAAMSVDVASQAVHLALVELESCMAPV